MSEENVNPIEETAEIITPVEETAETIIPESTEKNEDKYDKDRIHITNLPILGFKQFKHFLSKNLEGLNPKKVRQLKGSAYVSLATPEEADKAIEVLNGFQIKRCTLVVKRALTEVRTFNSGPSENGENGREKIVPKTALESVTPLHNIPYEEQLKKKHEASLDVVRKLVSQMRKAQRNDVPRPVHLLRPIKPSPKIKEYRNKCEFTCGLTLDGEICVGFVGGRYSKNEHYVIPADDVENITNQTKAIVKDFKEFVLETGLRPLNEAEKTGVWRLLTVREFGGDVMVIVSVYPFGPEKEAEIKEKLSARLLDISNFTNKGYRVTSLYWQSIEHCSDTPDFVHIGGAPFIYESLMDCRFRVSPSAFFQTNSQAACVLYQTIGEACGITSSAEQATAITPPEAEKKVEDNLKTEDEGVECKRIKLDEKETSPQSTVLLDVCCGTGTIGQCLMKSFNNDKLCCVGIEMIESAVEDAKMNCRMNNIPEEKCRYLAGKAENVFKSLKYNMPTGFSLDTSNVVGILDPPRAGLHEKVVLGCRQMDKLKRLVFVSCDPNAATKNLVDFCRPTSKKYDGTPFSIDYIQPVDMFPQTNHFEWVVSLSR
ncbi:unnamed protein product [Auanema sp. JU1783]|nr:unnamed protein product [Auanema sp. JU1783]